MHLILVLLRLGGGVALLMWGVHMVQTGMQRAFGARLRRWLGHALRRRDRAFLAGIGVTALLQSSTATGLMVTGFAAGGLVELMPALAVMLGANVGTTLIVQVLSFDVSAVSPALLLAGVGLFRRAGGAVRDFGRVLIGLGLLLMALREFIAVLQPYAEGPALHPLLTVVSASLWLDIALAAVATWAMHSSVAVVLLVMSFAAHGAIPPQAACALVLGANLGTAINPVLEGGAVDPASRRLPLGNLLNRVAGVIAAGALLPWLAPPLMRLIPDPARAVADFHTLFNLALAALFLPALAPYANLLRRLLPARADEADPGLPMYLSAAAREAPVVALGEAAREALRLADMVDAMLVRLREALVSQDRRPAEAARRLDGALERLNAAIQGYVTALDQETMSDGDRRRAGEILAFAANFENAGDVIARNLCGHAARRQKRGVGFSPAAQAAMLGALDRVAANARMAASLFVSEDVRAARLLAAEKAGFRRLEAEATVAHLARMRSGDCGNAESGALYQDILRDMKRLNAHFVAAAAYPVLERLGELLPSRLRVDDG